LVQEPQLIVPNICGHLYSDYFLSTGSLLLVRLQAQFVQRLDLDVRPEYCDIDSRVDVNHLLEMLFVQEHDREVTLDVRSHNVCQLSLDSGLVVQKYSVLRSAEYDVEQ